MRVRHFLNRQRGRLHHVRLVSVWFHDAVHNDNQCSVCNSVCISVNYVFVSKYPFVRLFNNNQQDLVFVAFTIFNP